MQNRGDNPERRIEKLERINAALIERLERIEEARGPAWSMNRANAVLQREILSRNQDLETALADLAAINSELAAAREVADQANRAKSRFLRAASHDLLQPLSAAKLFLSHLGELSHDQFQRDLVSHLKATIDSAEELIRALSNIAKLDSRSLTMHRAPIAMSRLFRRLMIDMQPLANSRNIDLRFVPTSATVQSDPLYLRQIAQNLIVNALHYTTGHKVLVGLRHAGEYVWLEVLDQGPGIAAKDQDRIFNEFERLSRMDQPGTGLGLSIVRRACEQLAHPLELHSELGSGSRFRVQLPLLQPEALSAAQEASTDEAEVQARSFDGRRVLVVENDFDMRHAYAVLLRGWGMEVQVASSIAEASAAAARFVPDLVLTDYRLDDGETGIATLHRLNAEHRVAFAALIVSAESAEAIRTEAAGLQVEVLEKPVAEYDLRRAMRAALMQTR